MKLAIMQPYFFPYIGYFQLIHAADAFVLYDDVNFIKGGWINRNYISSLGEKLRLTLQLQGASPNKLINEIHLGMNRKQLLRTIQQNYSKAPEFSVVYPLLEELLLSEENMLSNYLAVSLKRLCDFMGLKTTWFTSSELKKDNSLRGQDKVIAICEELGATHYINLPGGKDLYDHDSFKQRNIELSFIAPHPVEYPQLRQPFIPQLSIIDVLMFNNKKQCGKLLENYALD